MYQTSIVDHYHQVSTPSFHFQSIDSLHSLQVCAQFLHGCGDDDDNDDIDVRLPTIRIKFPLLWLQATSHGNSFCK